MIPKNLNKYTNGTIEQRQTTFVRITLSDGKEYKISYQKKEFLIEPGDFIGIYFDQKHPLLKHYQDDFLKIYISSGLEDFNSQYDISKLIQEGFGFPYDGPTELGFKVSNVLRKYGTIHNYKKYSRYRKPDMKVLVIGKNIIVAEEFKFKRFKP